MKRLAAWNLAVSLVTIARCARLEGFDVRYTLEALAKVDSKLDLTEPIPQERRQH